MQYCLHMVNRTYWLNMVERAWRRRNIVWLSGVRRAGKTCLCRTVPHTEYFDCELPRTRRLMEGPEEFLDGRKGRRIVLDEIHRLDNPSELLKIAADHYPETHILATGSSTLGASTKFKDTLAGRKHNIRLTPMILADLDDFGNTDLKHRLFRGGLPPFFLTEDVPERDFQEWMDAYWAKDIQELFRLERRHSFQKFAELLMINSGGIFEATTYASPCEVSRTTIANYLTVLENTHVMHVVRPFSSHAPTEIVAAPKVYAFDTGFVCYHRGWHDLREEDRGTLWEHFVLNEIQATLQDRKTGYWRDKRGHEVDFVRSRRGAAPVAVECKWKADNVDAANLAAFRRRYPGGENFVVAGDVGRSFTRRIKDTPVRFVSLPGLVKRLTG